MATVVVRRWLRPAQDRWLAVGAVRRLQLARYWYGRGDLDEAARHVYRAMRLVERSACPPRQAVDIAYTAALIERDRARYAESYAQLQHAVSVLHRQPPSVGRDRRLVYLYLGLGDAHRRAGRYGQAATDLATALRLVEAAVAVDPAALAAVLMLFGVVAKEQGAFEDAQRYYGEVARLQEDAGASAADAAALQHNLAGLAHARRRYAAAERHARQAVQLRRAARGATPVDIAQDVAVLAAAVAGAERNEEARGLFHEALAVCRGAHPARDYEIAVHLHNLAAIEQACGQAEESERLYREALAIKQRLLGPDHPEIALVVHNLGTLLAERRRVTEAAHCFRQALQVATHTYTPDHPLIESARGNLVRLDQAGG